MIQDILDQFRKPWEDLEPADKEVETVLSNYLKEHKVVSFFQAQPHPDQPCFYGGISGRILDEELFGVQIFLNYQGTPAHRALALAHQVGHLRLHLENGFRCSRLTRTQMEIEAELFAIYLYYGYYGSLPEVCRQYLIKWGFAETAISHDIKELVSCRADVFLKSLF